VWVSFFVFVDWDDDIAELGEKIAEGAQGEIFLIRTRRPEEAARNETAVLKVYGVWKTCNSNGPPACSSKLLLLEIILMNLVGVLL
jgi:hypothetical protein